MRSKLNILLFLFTVLILSCTPITETKTEQSELQIQGAAQGTSYTVKYLGEKHKKLPEQLDSLLAAIDKSLSTYDTSSLITAFNRGDTILPDQMLLEMIQFSEELNNETNGAFDPTIGPIIRAWGFDLSKAQKMDSIKVDSLLALKGFDHINQQADRIYLDHKGASLNFNAIAQGYSVDLMADLLESYSIEDYYIELGGEIKVKGKNTKGENWKIGIDKPVDDNLNRDLIAIVSMENASIATSGNYRKFYLVDGKKYSHTIDPQSGYPVQHSLLSASVISKDCYRADALATAFMVMGKYKALDFLKNHPSDLAFLVYAEEDGSYGYFMSPKLEESIEKTAD